MSRLFSTVRAGLEKHGLLVPAKLATLPRTSLRALVELASAGLEPNVEDLEAILIWLEKEHEDAKAIVELARISDCSSWNERRYIAKKASHEEDRMVRKNAAQFEISVKVARRAGIDIKA